MTWKTELLAKGKLAKSASRELAITSTTLKNNALALMADALVEHVQEIIAGNQKDIENARMAGMKESLIDRLMLDEKRVVDMANGLRKVIELQDPVGEMLTGMKRPNGLEIAKVRVPFGVVGIVYESRPNVTVDAAGLCLKTGNAVILRGGSDAIESNKVIVGILQEATMKAGLPVGTVNLIEVTDREAVREMLQLNEFIDVIIPRGGSGLIQMVLKNSTVPVIETGIGVCHVYIDQEADLVMAEEIAINAKTSRPGTCNTIETLLVHRDQATQILPSLLGKLQELGVEIRGCGRTQSIFPKAIAAVEEDWGTEYLDFILSVCIVDSFEDAVEHITKYGTKHSEAIVTTNYARSERFLREIDAAAVFVNASTRFTDGGEFGFGAEIGISTQKLHARGPMGLPELTSYKYLIRGNGQIR
jgi:gamma-glutamyl phosphate reductase